MLFMRSLLHTWCVQGGVHLFMHTLTGTIVTLDAEYNVTIEDVKANIEEHKDSHNQRWVQQHNCVRYHVYMNIMSSVVHHPCIVDFSRFYLPCHETLYLLYKPLGQQKGKFLH